MKQPSIASLKNFFSSSKIRIPASVGPDQNSIIARRPYFLVPVENEAQRNIAMQRIVRYAQRHQVADVYVISHGWHRNFYSAISAYDRLVSRFFILMRRGLLPKGNTKRPLIIALHWHSDPGRNKFEDTDGKRDKRKFFDLASTLFRQRFGNDDVAFYHDFDGIFSIFCSATQSKAHTWTSPNTSRTDDLWLTLDRKGKMAHLLQRYELKEAKGSSLDEKIVTVWRCYHEARSDRTLTERLPSPARYEKPSISLFASILRSTGRIALILISLALIKPLCLLIWSILQPHPFFWGMIVYFCVFYWTSRWRAYHPNGTLNTPPWIALPFGLLPTLLFVIPLMAWIVIRWAVGSIFTLFSGKWLNLFTYPEKTTRTGFLHNISLRWGLSLLTLVPIRWMRRALPKDSKTMDFVSALENQLSFFVMQRKAVRVGETSANFLKDLCKQSENLSNAQFHFIGHSFGASVVCNTARRLALDNSPVIIRTLCLIEAAMAQEWLKTERTLLNKITGVVANIFSRYDTATGAYYPLANNARVAAGSKGMFKYQNVCGLAVYRCNFDALNTPPDLNNPLFVGFPPLSTVPSHITPKYYDLDTSRLIFNGPILTGGGHDDIFKSDIIHLLYAACTA